MGRAAGGGAIAGREAATGAGAGELRLLERPKPMSAPCVPATRAHVGIQTRSVAERAHGHQAER